MEKMREEFEQAWAETRCDDDGIIGNKPTRSAVNADCYAGGAAQFAWMWWKRSRAALCVKIPKHGEVSSFGDHVVFDADAVREILDEAGVSYE